MDLIKVLWLIYKQSVGTFTMLLVKVFSQTRLFRHLSDYDYGVRNFEITKSMRVIFFSKFLKFNLDFKTLAKNWEKVICFWDNFIWIGIVKLSLVRTGYFSSGANVLTSSPKIWHVIKRNVFQLNWLGVDQWIWQSCCDADFNGALARLPCSLPKGSPKLGFLDIYLTTFSESVISKLQNVWGNIFSQNVQNFIEISKMQQEIEKKFFVFEIIASELRPLNCLS